MTVSDPALPSNSFPSWSPDGSTLIYQRVTSNNEELYAVPSVGGTEVRLTNTPLPVKEKWARTPPTAPRSCSTRRTRPTTSSTALYVADADGTDRAVLATPGYDYAAFAVWAPSAGSTPPAPTTAAFTADAPAQVKRTKSVKVTLRCLGDVTCVVSSGAVVKVPAHGSTPKRTFALDEVATTLAGHTTTKVKPKPTKAARTAIAAALAAGKRPAYRIRVVAERTGGQLIRTVTLRVKVTG